MVRPYSILLCYYYEVFVSNCKICMLASKTVKIGNIKTILPKTKQHSIWIK